MGKGLWGWLAWFVFLFLVDFFVPFRLLAEVPSVAGSFLFWILWVVAAIASMFVIFLRWREPEVQDQRGRP
jgi:hypothetical protein